MTQRILVVEDQEDLRGVLRDLLTGSGYEMLEAVDGGEGVTKAKSERPDLILMDIQLPVLDGYETTRQIKADPRLRPLRDEALQPRPAVAHHPEPSRGSLRNGQDHPSGVQTSVKLRSPASSTQLWRRKPEGQPASPVHVLIALQPGVHPNAITSRQIGIRQHWPAREQLELGRVFRFGAAAWEAWSGSHGQKQDCTRGRAVRRGVSARLSPRREL